jgi:hypothetical protein
MKMLLDIHEIWDFLHKGSTCDDNIDFLLHLIKPW